jgi:hypothetical protein
MVQRKNVGHHYTMHVVSKRVMKPPCFQVRAPRIPSLSPIFETYGSCTSGKKLGDKDGETHFRVGSKREGGRKREGSLTNKRHKTGSRQKTQKLRVRQKDAERRGGHDEDRQTAIQTWREIPPSHLL